MLVPEQLLLVGLVASMVVALSLLREIRDLLAEISNEEAGEHGEGELPELPPEGSEDHPEGDEGDGEEEGDQFKPGKRPMPVPSGVE